MEITIKTDCMGEIRSADEHWIKAVIAFGVAETESHEAMQAAIEGLRDAAREVVVGQCCEEVSFSILFYPSGYEGECIEYPFDLGGE